MLGGRSSPAVIVLTLLAASACDRCGDAGRTAEGGPLAPLPSATVATARPQASAGAPRPGMAWIPAGTLRAGTPRGKVPRIPDEELAGVAIPMQGFYIDILPFPNEPGAIATSNVSRDEAAQQCAAQGKRLCTELEWERACKGPENATYEYGEVYRQSACGTGVPPEDAARRPTGGHVQCKSGFGVLEMHGGVWEWTDSAWGRGQSGDLGVLRGGNAVAGELVGRCANGLARPPKTKSPTMGFRCCAGPRNDATVELTLETGPALVPLSKTEAARLVPMLAKSPDSKINPAAPFIAAGAWRWRPAANEVLLVLSGCTWEPSPAKGTCAFGVARDDGEPAKSPVFLAAIPTDRMIVDVGVAGERRKLQALGFDSLGSYVRDISWAYGSVAVAPLRRK
jgi:sulfatase modifying factor 1